MNECFFVECVSSYPWEAFWPKSSLRSQTWDLLHPFSQVLAFFPSFLSLIRFKKRIGLRDSFRLFLRGPYRITYVGHRAWGGVRGPKIPPTPHTSKKKKKKSCRERGPGLGPAVDPISHPHSAVSSLLDTYPQKREMVCNQSGCYCCRKIQFPPPKKKEIYIILKEMNDTPWCCCATKKKQNKKNNKVNRVEKYWVLGMDFCKKKTRQQKRSI